MLSISNPISGGRGDYYVNLGREDYYKAEEAGGWFGRGAVEFALSRKISTETFRNLLRGYDPSGRMPLVQNAGKDSRQQGWDLTFSAPKDVSVLWALSEKPARFQIHAAHRRAVEKALSYIEETAGVSRRGKGGRKKEKSKLIFARFEHFTSRALDPQIHTHAVLINLSVREDRTTGTIQSKDVFNAKMRGGELYRAALAGGLKQLGYEIEPSKVGFRLPAVPIELSQAFSKRRRAIVRLMAERNESGALAAKNAALRTRKKKEEISKAELFSIWKKVGDEFQFKSPAQEKPIEHQPEKKGREQKEEKAAPKVEPRQGKQEWDNRSAKTEFSDRDGSEQCETSRSARTSFVRIESRFLFPHAPLWSPASKVKLPRIVVGYPSEKVWGKVRSKKNLIFADLLVQERKLFPNAPKWSPASKVKVPAFRVKPKALLEKWLPGMKSSRNAQKSGRRSGHGEKAHGKSKGKSQSH